MSRLSQANQLWSSLLGKGRGNTARRQIVEQNAGQLPITPEVLDDVMEGMGDTAQRQYVERLLGTAVSPFGRSYGGGGSRSGSGTPHYGPLSGETGEIQFTDHGTGQTFHQVEMSPEDDAELAKREAMQQEKLDAELIQRFGAVLQGEYERQPAAFAEVYRPAITAIASGQMPTAENDAIIMSRRRKEGAQRAALVDYLSSNASNLTQADTEELWQQHFMQYPEFAEGQQPPMTREERIQQQRVQEEQMFQGTLDEFATANGLPKIPVRRNEKGVLEPIVNIETLISSQRQASATAQSAVARDANTRFRARVAAAKAKMPQKPGVESLGNAAAQQQYEAGVDAVQQEIQSAYEELNRALQGPVPGAESQPTSPPPADTPQQLPPMSFNSGPEAERAFDSGRLQADQPFVVNGVTVAFDANGVVYRVE